MSAPKIVDIRTQKLCFPAAPVMGKNLFDLWASTRKGHGCPQEIQTKKFIINCTIAHKKITELIPKQFRFGNSSTEITEYNSQNISVK